jgi:hypothetical protein
MVKKMELETKNNDVSSYSKAPMMRESPFMDDLVIKTRKKRITVARGSAIVDEVTGEISGRTEIGQVIEVDSEEFIKVFPNEMAKWFDFEKSTQKLFSQMLIKVQTEAINRDIFYYSLDDMVSDTGYSKQTLYKCLTELINKKVIAKHQNQNLFFLNPRFLFNGDRADFVKSYRISRVSKLKTNENPNQLELLNRDPKTVDLLTRKTDEEAANGTN